MKDLHNKLNEILSIIKKKESTTLQFDINIYIKCLIHELQTPITTVSLGLNTIEYQLIKEPTINHMLLNTIHDLYKTIEHIDNTLTKFCVIQDGDMILNKFEVFSINYLINTVQLILQFNIKEKNINIDYIVNDDINDWIYGDIYNIQHVLII